MHDNKLQSQRPRIRNPEGIGMMLIKTDSLLEIGILFIQSGAGLFGCFSERPFITESKINPISPLLYKEEPSF